MDAKLTASLLVITIVLVATGVYLNPAESQPSRDVYWNGQDVVLEDQIEDDTVYSIYNESGENFIRQVKSDENGVLTVETEDYGEGKFDIVEPTGGVTVYKYTNVGQNFGVEAGQTVAIDEVVEYEILSGRAVFNMNITSSNMDTDQLIDGLEIDSSKIAEIEDGVTVSDVESGETIKFDTSEIDSNDYSIEWNVTDAIGTDETRLVTGAEFTGSARFDGNLFAVNQGDPAEVYLNLVDTDRVTIELGRNIYTHEFELRDADGDGRVGFKFDTLEAGNAVEPVDGLNGTRVIGQDDDENLDVDVLAPITYTMVAKTGEETEDTAILDIQNPVFNGIKTYELSSGVDPTVRSQVTENVNEADSIADKEYVVVDVGVSSVYSLLPENVDGVDLSDSGVLSNSFGWSLVIEESDPGINSPSEEYDLEDAESAFAIQDENRILVVIDADELPNIDKEDGDRYSSDVLNSYEVQLEVDSEDNRVFEDDIKANRDFTVENTVLEPSNRELDIDPFEDRTHVLNIEDPEIQMEGNLAEGREVAVIADTIETELLIFERGNITDGEVSFPVNKSQIELGDEFRIEVPSTGYNYDFIVGSSDIIEDVTAPSEVKEGDDVSMSVELKDTASEANIETEWQVNDQSFFGRTLNYSYQGDGNEPLTVDVEASSSDEQFLDTEKVNVETIPAEDPVPEPTIQSNLSPLLFEGQTVNFTSSVSNVTDTESENVEYEWRLNDEVVEGGSQSASIQLERGMNRVSIRAMYNEKVGSDEVQFYAYPSTPISRIIVNYYLS